MPRKPPEPVDDRLAVAEDEYMAAKLLEEATIDAACHFGEEEGFDLVWMFAQQRLRIAKRVYVRLLIEAGRVER